MTEHDTPASTPTEPASLPPCPECASEYAYESGALLVCPMCGHEWAPADPAAAGDGSAAGGSDDDGVIRDAVGNVLADGDTVALVKSVKVSGGGGGTIKVGTKVRGIRLTADQGDGHDIDAKLPDFGKLKLKSSVVKKVS
ncbi:zinc ribbon domain-containing protein YjdM [Leucobacter luti]|uniref:Protein PhnA n=1 Tax=Leucobacter luti TaxID=340320 RepID=A0A4Q7U4G1_9MICO|nr:zinc ribbon domain-containing protein YjdM [Leucobacter luti]MBL3700608.1 alkylphosphonate utilization protein [Leucobacter luti]RZT68554.1 protein PhnA [Leucobacter luti]